MAATIFDCDAVPQPPFSRSRQRPCELSPAFQSRDHQRISPWVAAATVDFAARCQPSLPRL